MHTATWRLHCSCAWAAAVPLWVLLSCAALFVVVALVVGPISASFARLEAFDGAL